MEWHELGRVRSGIIAPDFTLASGTGETVTRAQFRQRCNLVLFFLFDTTPSAVTPALDLLSARRTSFDEASARVYAISGQPAPVGASPLLLSDPGDTVRARFAGLFPEGHEPGTGEVFSLVLDRYSKPWYAGRGAIDETAVDEALTKLWAIEYDCPE